MRRHVIWDYSACVWMSFCVCTLLLWANVILAEMSVRFLRSHMRDLGCACVWMLGDNAICKCFCSPCGPGLWQCGVADIFVQMSGYVCDHLSLWSDWRPTLSLIATTLRSLAPSSFLTALTFSGQKHSLSFPGCHLSILLNNPFYRSCSTTLSLPHFNLLFSRSLRLKWFRVFFSPSLGCSLEVVAGISG